LISLTSGDTDAVVPVTATRYSIDALKLPTIINWYPWYDNGKVSIFTDNKMLEATYFGETVGLDGWGSGPNDLLTATFLWLGFSIFSCNVAILFCLWK
jgi:hypothetical protein